MEISYGQLTEEEKTRYCFIESICYTGSKNNWIDAETHPNPEVVLKDNGGNKYF